MYKIDVSWYYCQSKGGPLRLFRTIKNIRVCGTPPTDLHGLPVDTLICMDHSGATPIERRCSPRLRANCDAEISADLSILDTEIDGPSKPLVFMGQTRDLSKFGVSIILPSLLIDERFCTDRNRLELSLFLPQGAVTMIVSPVRCLALDKTQTGMGYLLGARIDKVLDHREDFEQFLLSLAPS